MTEFSIRTTKRNEFVEITDRVQQAVTVAGISEGLCVVYCPHTTAAITVNENADRRRSRHDPVPEQASRNTSRGSGHAEQNSDSHIKASLVGPSVTLIVSGGKVVLGQWQGIYFCEFDGRGRGGCNQVVGDHDPDQSPPLPVRLTEGQHEQRGIRSR